MKSLMHKYPFFWPCMILIVALVMTKGRILAQWRSLMAIILLWISYWLIKRFVMRVQEHMKRQREVYYNFREKSQNWNRYERPTIEICPQCGTEKTRHHECS